MDSSAADTPRPFDVAPLPVDRVDEAARLLATAFEGDPTWGLLLPPDTPDRDARLRAVFAVEIRSNGAENAVAALDRESGDLLGVSVWAPPHPTTSRGTRWAAAWASARSLGLRGLVRTARFERAAAAPRPPEPHWHLLDIVAAPAAQGRGVGGALLTHRLALADAEGRRASLESTTPGSRRLYERHGFTVTGQLPDELGGAWTMVREPLTGESD